MQRQTSSFGLLVMSDRIMTNLKDLLVNIQYIVSMQGPPLRKGSGFVGLCLLTWLRTQCTTYRRQCRAGPWSQVRSGSVQITRDEIWRALVGSKNCLKLSTAHIHCACVEVALMARDSRVVWQAGNVRIVKGCTCMMPINVGQVNTESLARLTQNQEDLPPTSPVEINDHGNTPRLQTSTGHRRPWTMITHQA